MRMPPPRRRRRLAPTLLLVGLALPLAARGGDDEVGELRIVANPPLVERRSFDPQGPPPAGLPPFEVDQRAATDTEFRIAVAIETLGGKPRRRDDGYLAKVRVTAIELTPRLTVTIWLPTDADAWLVAHEEGHRAIAERAYAEGEAFIRELAGGYLGRELRGEGATADEARDAATRLLVEELSAAWLARTHGVAGEVGDAYDQLTDHARNRELAAEAAVEQVYATWAAGRLGSVSAPADP